MKRVLAQAEQLMIIKDKIWDKLNICCAWSSSGENDVESKKDEHDSMLEAEIRKLGYSTKIKVSEEVRQYLENKNYHTVNRVLQERNLGEGNY